MKKLITLVLILTLTTGLFSNDKVVNVAALKGPTGLSMVNLIHNNSMLDGEKAKYNIVNTPQLVTAGLLSGEYDIAALPTNLAAIIFNKKPGYQLAAVTGEGTLYVLSSRDDISTWADLKGKKVHNIARASTPGFLFNNLLTENSIDPKNDLEIDFKFNHVELAPMLIAGKVETGILPEPLVTKVLLKNKKMKVVLDFQDEYKRTKKTASSYPLSCIVVKKSLIESNPELVKDFLKQLEASINFVNSNPMEAGKKGEEVGLGVNGALIKNSISRLNLGFKHSKEAKEELENYYKILHSSNPKSVGGKIPSEGFYYEG